MEISELHTIEQILLSLEVTSLSEMDDVKLMNRLDRKFIFNVSFLPEILKQLSSHYKVLCVNNTRLNNYESLYFDTPEYTFYQNHQCGKSNRFKVRMREYVDSRLKFFEVKFKNNKGRTIKNRVQLKDEKFDLQLLYSFVLKNNVQHANLLEPKFWVKYKRITLVNKKEKERVTLDLSLTFEKEPEASMVFDSLVIAEVKQDKYMCSSFVSLMKKFKIIQGGISKYCWGATELIPSLRSNLFKNKLRIVKKQMTNRSRI